MSAIELRRGRSGRWRWSYRETPGGKALPGNEDYEDVASARAAAAGAYPGVPITVAGADEADDDSRGGGGKLSRWAGLLVIVLAWARRGRR